MKRLFSALAALFICLLLLPLPARANVSRADVRLNVLPVQGANDELILEVDLSVANGLSDQFISNVEMVYDNKTIASLPEIYGSSDLSLRTEPLGIGYSTVYSDIIITIYYIDFDGAPMENSYLVPMFSQHIEPKLTFTRTAAPVEGQNKMRLSYTLRNDGEVALSNLEVTDSIAPDGSIAYLDFLDVGRSETFTLDVSVSGEAQSRPQVNYIVSGGSAKVYQLSLEPLSLTLSNPKLTLSLKSDLNSILSNETATLTLNVSNDGNTPFTSVTITDETLGVIAENTAMDIGKVNTYTKIVTPAQTTSYRFTAVALDAAGNSYSVSSDPLVIEVLPAETPAPVSLLELEVTAANTVLEAPGEIALSMVVRNSGQTMLEQLTISDGRGMVLTRTSNMEPGVQVFNISISVSESTTFTFLVEALQPDGQPIQAASSPIEIEVATLETLLPSQSPAPTPSTIPVNSGDTAFSPWLLVLFIFLILLIIACIVVLVLLQIRSRKRRQIEEEEDYITSMVYTSSDYPSQESYSYAESDEDARAEISRFASQYSPRKPESTPPVHLDDGDEPTVYKVREHEPSATNAEPRTRQDFPKG